jgi:amidase
MKDNSGKKKPEKPGIHAFGNDLLSRHDATALADMVRRREVSAEELIQAAVARIEKVNPALNAVQVKDYENALRRAEPNAGGFFAGIPSFIKDNTDVRGLPSCHGSAAVKAVPAKRDGAFAKQYQSLGFTILGKSTLPEFGFNCTTEYRGGRGTRNPWNPGYICGGSSGGSSALVASGAVPIAHANDGGGSIRIPAACCGLVGLKPTRGRLVDGELARTLPLNIVSEGVVTRTVRDTANFLHAAERGGKAGRLPAIGLVEGPSSRKLKVALVTESATGSAICPETLKAVRDTAKLLASRGHHVEEAKLPMEPTFADDFADYWGFLALMASRFGRFTFGSGFDRARTDGLTRGLAARFSKNKLGFPGMLWRLRRSQQVYAKFMESRDLILSPVLGHTVPEFGFLSPDIPYDELFGRILSFVCFTPLNNASGSPALSVPAGLDARGLPLAVHFSAAHGDERTLLEIAFLLEQERPFPLIDRVR